MFHYGRFLGQDEFDIEQAAYTPPPSVAPIEEVSPAQRIEVYQQQAATLYPDTTSVVGNVLPVLQSIVSGAAPVVAEYLKLQSVKSQAAAISQMTPTQQAAYLATTAPKVVTPVQAGLALPSNWPILAIIGIGALLVLKGRKPSAPVKMARVRRRR